MATVYLAMDQKHHRRVAIKVLRPELGAVIGADRFLAEIRVTANLQHPHILGLIDSGLADGLVYYVMPYVEGDSLRERLVRETQLGIDDAVDIARQVAGALEYAHRRGVIHRDVKPENILLQDGQALVADFGIALALHSAGGNRLTETGISLGTPQYMSPEQASGERTVDARTDVYALGCVLYEMLAGEPPITGPTTQATIARLMMEEPRPLTLFRKTIPHALEAVVFKALAKLPADRFATVADFAAALDDPEFHLRTAATRRAPAPGPAAPGWRRAGPVLVGLTVLLGALAVWGWFRGGSSPAGSVARFVMSFAPGEEPGLSYYGTSFTLSRDGTRMAYIGSTPRGQQLLVRSRDQLNATPVPGTVNVYSPAFSPDGESVAFVTGSPGALRVVPISGGPPVTLVSDGVLVVHLLWSRDGYVYYTDVTGALARVRASGGSPQVVARPDTTRGQRWLTHPDVTEDGKVVVFTIWPSGPSRSGADPDVAAARLPGGDVQVLIHGMNGHPVATGQLVFADPEHNLLAAPFDEGALALTATPRSLGVRVAVAPDGSAQYSLSASGTLLYAAGEDAVRQRAAWVGRDGRISYVDTTWTGRVISLALSPDGKRLAVSQGDRGGTDIWVKTLDRGPLTQLTHWGSQTYRPAWSADGKSITFVSNHEGIQKLFSISADGTGVPRLLFAPANGLDEGGWSPDGRWLIVRSGVGVHRDIVGVRPGTDTTQVPLVVTDFEEFSPAVSPDGRWLAYGSDESGRPEVYVRPFPRTGDARWQVSAAGGIEPVWSGNGRELFYRNGANEIVVAAIGGPGFRVESQRKLFSAARLYSEGFHQTFAVASDGRFLFVEGKFESSAALVRVENWLEELRRPPAR